MKLNEIRDNTGAHRLSKRVGRGIGSGKGKTCGRGQKGQKARSGVSLNGFEGGQLPLYQRLPKRGFRNHFKKHFAVINLRDISAAFEAGKLKEGDEITEALLKECGLIRDEKCDGVRVLGNGELSYKIDCKIAGVSASAKAAIEKVGGTVTLVTKKAS